MDLLTGLDDTEKKYIKAYTKRIRGLITDEEWSIICMRILNELMEQNKDVLERLKNS